DEKEIDEDDDETDEQDDEIDEEAEDGKDDSDDELWSPKTIGATTKNLSVRKLREQVVIPLHQQRNLSKAVNL
nr:hypothetical protein [Tanacetum cinerariifolium]